MTPPPLSRLGLRLLAFNLLLVFLPVAALLVLGVFERQILASEQRALAQQGRILGAALSESGPLVPESARLILKQLGEGSTSRLQVLDASGALLADSRFSGPAEPLAPGSGSGLGSVLAGDEESWTRSDTAETSTLVAGVPVRSAGRVVGAVLASETTAGLQRELRKVRGGILLACLASLLVAAALSLWYAATLVRPLRRLRREAAALLERRTRQPLAEATRGDEIGDLARTLTELSERLDQQLQFASTVVADVSHEFKNPLAAIRGAAEMLAEVEEPAERRRFAALLQGEIVRLEKLLGDVRDVARIDQRIADEARAPLDFAALLAALVEDYARRAPGRVELNAPEAAASMSVLASPDRLVQVTENLIDNAISLSPAGSLVTLELNRQDDTAVLTVRDRGPGIPEQHLDRIFDRFFSYRPPIPAAVATQHSGLGLAIVRGIVRAYGGSVAARNAPDGGAIFEIRLPLADLSGLALAKT